MRLRRLVFAVLLLAIALPLQADFGGGGGKGGTSFSVIMVNLAQGDDAYEFAQAPRQVTLIDASCYCRGTCGVPTATLTFQDRAGNAIPLTTTPLTCNSGATDSTYMTFDTSNANRILNAGEGLRLNVTNIPNPETDEYTIQVRFR